MKYLVIKYLEYKIKKAVKRMNEEDNEIVKKAFRHMVESLANTKLFLSVS